MKNVKNENEIRKQNHNLCFNIIHGLDITLYTDWSFFNYLCTLYCSDHSYRGTLHPHDNTTYMYNEMSTEDSIPIYETPFNE